MVEVFKTDITKIKIAKTLRVHLHNQFPDYKVNFDLADCDKILRIESDQICVNSIIELVRSLGYHCEVLE